MVALLNGLEITQATPCGVALCDMTPDEGVRVVDPTRVLNCTFIQVMSS